MSVIIRMAEYCQSLPHPNKTGYGFLGGLLQHQLEQCCLALKVRRNRMLPPHASPEEVKQKADQYTYVILALALTTGLEDSLCAFKVRVFTFSRKELSIWNQAEGSLTEIKKARKFQFEHSQEAPRQSMAMPICLLTQPGIEWLSSEGGIYDKYSAALEGIDKSSGICKVINEALRVMPSDDENKQSEQSKEGPVEKTGSLSSVVKKVRTKPSVKQPESRSGPEQKAKANNKNVKKPEASALAFEKWAIKQATNKKLPSKLRRSAFYTKKGIFLVMPESLNDFLGPKNKGQDVKRIATELATKNQGRYKARIFLATGAKTYEGILMSHKGKPSQTILSTQTIDVKDLEKIEKKAY